MATAVRTRGSAGPSAGPPARTGRERLDHHLPGLVLRAVLGLGLALVLALWWGNTTAGRLDDAGSVVTALGRVAGLTAAYVILVQVWLMARLPWFERAVGQDRLAAWHRWLGTDAVTLIALHVALVVVGYGLTVHRAPLSELATVVTTYPEMWKATIGSLLFLAVGLTSGRALRRRLSYEAWYAVHLITYPALLLVFGHQSATGQELVDRPWARIAWQLLCYGSVGLVVAFRLAQPVRAWWRHRLVVDAVTPEGPGVVSVWVRGHDLAALRALPGQFLGWRFAARGHWLTAHPYSLSAPVRGDRLRITVKDSGDHSGALARLRPGTPVLVEGPFGRFTADRSSGRPALLVAGGVGIGPVRAVAEALVARGNRDVVVVFRARSEADLVLVGELRAAAAQGRLRLHELPGRRTELGADPLATERLAALVPDLATRDVWVCGPPGLITSVTASARHLGAPAHRVHSEEFAL